MSAPDKESCGDHIKDHASLKFIRLAIQNTKYQTRNKNDTDHRRNSL
jgi:hypothetical protein